jgi:hypothetical protein
MDQSDQIMIEIEEALMIDLNKIIFEYVNIHTLSDEYRHCDFTSKKYIDTYSTVPFKDIIRYNQDNTIYISQYINDKKVSYSTITDNKCGFINITATGCQLGV